MDHIAASEKPMSRARALGAAMLLARDGRAAKIEGFKGRVLLGSIGAAWNLDGLLEDGVTHILCVASALPMKFPGKFVYERIEVLDKPGEDIESHFDRAFSFIECTLAENETNRLLVHCFQGKSRSVTIVTAFLMKRQGYTMEEALTIIRKTRPNAQPNLGFSTALRRFGKSIQNET